MTDFPILHILKSKQYKNVYFANFVYYEKTRLQLMDLKLRGKVKAILISKCTNYSLSKLFILFIDHNIFSIGARNTHISKPYIFIVDGPCWQLRILIPMWIFP